MANATTARIPDRFLSMDGVSAYQVTIASAANRGNSLRQIVFTGPDLASFTYQPGQDIMVPLIDGPDKITTRRYSVRSFDAAGPTLTLEIVLHSGGLGMNWAKSLQPGDSLEIAGPRGKIFLRESADWHLFLADESGITNSLAMLESTPAGSPSQAVLLVESPAEVADWNTGDPRITWVYRQGAAPTDASPLLAALDRLSLPEGDGHVYVAGEVSLVNAVRKALIEKGYAEDSYSTKAYWRVGRANAAHGEPEKQ